MMTATTPVCQDRSTGQVAISLQPSIVKLMPNLTHEFSMIYPVWACSYDFIIEWCVMLTELFPVMHACIHVRVYIRTCVCILMNAETACRD